MNTARIWSASILLLALIGPLTGCSDSSASASDPGASPAVGDQGVVKPAGMGQAQGLLTGDSDALFADYKRLCAGKRPRSRECEILRSLIVAKVVLALEWTERTRDQRGVAQALTALEFPEEPEVFVAGMRILARFVETPGVAAKVLPQVLENRYIEVQRIGATLLSALPDETVANVGRQWLSNHGALDAATPYAVYPAFPRHAASLGFPKYPGAEWYSPADSDRSIGWSTTDAVAAVTKWFSQELKAEPVDGNQWFAQQQQELRQSMQSNQQRTLELTEKALKGDKAAAAELEKLSKQMQDAGAVIEQGFMGLTYPSSIGAEGRWIVAKKKDGRVSTVVVVYPMPGVQRTVIQQAWHLADYPSAWAK
jgi:hypothetical protein